MTSDKARVLIPNLFYFLQDLNVIICSYKDMADLE